jgi:predicted N-acyltransferase
MSSTLSCTYQLLTKVCSPKKAIAEIMVNELIQLENNIQIHLSETIDSCSDWSKIAKNQTLFLQPEYLNALESCPPKGMRFAYLTFYKNNQPCGIAYAQIFNFSTYESLKHHKSFNDENAKFLTVKKWLAHRMKFCAIVCGNILMTGEYGYRFDKQLVNDKEQFSIVNQGLEVLRQQLKTKGIKASVTLFKDYFENGRQDIKNTSFSEFQIQPNMVINLKADWKKFDDYLAAMSSKYRVRAKSAFKKAKHIEKQELSLEEIKHYESQMFDLYNQVVVSAGFNGIELQTHYFTNLKERLGEKFKVIAYFKEEELIGFYTVFFEKELMESHYLGINQAENRPYQLYLNMLYDMIRMGIYREVKQIFLARTALEIKSSVGAVPHDLYFYLKNHNPIFNALAHKTFDWFNPQEEWTQRKPFK